MTFYQVEAQLPATETENVFLDHSGRVFVRLKRNPFQLLLKSTDLLIFTSAGLTARAIQSSGFFVLRPHRMGLEQIRGELRVWRG